MSQSPSITYQADDLYFDLEIRRDFFVCSQYYPQPNRLVVSFMEEPNLDQPLKTSVITESKDQKLKQITTKSAVKEQFQTTIRNMVTSFKDTTIEFENLLTLSGFMRFAKRYGYFTTKQRYDGDTASQRERYTPYNIAYDTDDHYDATKQGLRIGYNSQNYDQTLIAAYLGDLMYGVIEPLAKGQWLKDNGADRADYNRLGVQAKRAFQNQIFNATDPQTGLTKATGTPKTLSDLNSQMFAAVQQGRYMNDVFEKDGNADHTYRSWKKSNRFVDVSQMNPKKISLKRCAMALGFKIEESASNRNPMEPLGSLAEMASVVAYNANDVYVTMKLFESPTYANRFKQNKQLLAEFPYLIYEQADEQADSKLDYIKGQDHLRFRRLTVNDTSTSFVGNAIAPYRNTKIIDNPVLNLIYPAPARAQKLANAGQLPPLFHGHARNMLDYLNDLLDQRLAKYRQTTDEVTGQRVTNEVKHEFQRIRDFYQNYIGKNFNDEMDPIKTDHLTQTARQVALEKAMQVYRNSYLQSNSKWTNKVDWSEHDFIEALKDHTDDHTFQEFITPRDKVAVKFNNQTRTDLLQKLFTPESTTWDNAQLSPVYQPETNIKQAGLPTRLIVPYITPTTTYQDQHGVDLRSYAIISTGGAHGIEVQYSPFLKNQQAYEAYQQVQVELINWFNHLDETDRQTWFGDQLNTVEFPITVDNLAQAIAKLLPKEPYTHVKRRTLPTNDQWTFGDLLPSSASRKQPKLRKLKEPSVFDGNNKIKPEYAYTSSNQANHEDFDSYYPSLISNLEIFKNADGKDVFTEDLYHPRLKLKKIAKGKVKVKPNGTPYTPAEISQANLRQNSMKLLINAASGAGDASFSSNIKCNNKMMAMRIIGQLFCWYIGQSLSLAGARVPSTNTDGLYTMNLDAKLNNQIVEDCAQELLLGIGPEQLPLFVSKDANNRLEAVGTPADRTVIAARGAALTSWQGPSTDNAINHPAIVDYTLAQYLAKQPDAVNTEFNRKLAAKLMQDLLMHPEQHHRSYQDLMRYLQFPLVANAKSMRFLYLTDTNPDQQTADHITVLNATNRIFFAKATESHQTIKSTGLISIRPSAVKKRLQAGGVIKDPKNAYFYNIIENDPIAKSVVEQNLGKDNPDYANLFDQKYNPRATVVAQKPRDIKTIKISNLPTDTPVIVLNEDLNDLSDATIKQYIFQKFRLKLYLDMVENTFNNQWQNQIQTTN